MDTSQQTSHGAPSHLTIEPPIFYVGNPVALVTTTSPNGTVNIGPLSSTFTLGRTLVQGWESTSQTLTNLRRTGEAVVNYPDAALWQQVDAIALLTGHNPPAPHKADRFSHSDDKWSPSGFTPAPSELVQPPRIAQCPLQCEVTVDAIHDVDVQGPTGLAIVEGTIRRIHAHEDVMLRLADGTPDPRHVDTAAWQPLLYVFRDYFGTGSRLGSTRRAG